MDVCHRSLQTLPLGKLADLVDIFIWTSSGFHGAPCRVAILHPSPKTAWTFAPAIRFQACEENQVRGTSEMLSLC